MIQNKDRELARQCIDGLTLYATERLLGFENHQGAAAGLILNPEKRNARIRDLIGELAKHWALSENIEADFLTLFDERLRAAQCSFGVEMADFEQQRAVVQGLSRYANELADLPKAPDGRTKLLDIRYVLDEIYAYLPWDALRLGVNRARDSIERDLASMTATRNILFTRLLLGSERGPAASDFVSGIVKDAAGVLDTELYDDMQGQYPDIKTWPAICTIYRGGFGYGVAIKPENASELDLQIMRETGDDFLYKEGIYYCGGPYEFKVMQLEETEQQEQTMSQ